MKKLIAAAALLLAAALFAGCGTKAGANDGKLKIVCTVFPAYDWVREVLGDSESADLTLLLANGVDMHSYQPTAADMIKIADSDLFVYVGGQSDSWVDDVTKNSEKTREVSLFAINSGSVRVEELAEGMQADDDDSDGVKEYDEHLWLSFSNAKASVTAIAEELGALDPANAAKYAANAVAYNEKLDELEKEYREAANVPDPVLLFGGRFPFRYLTDDLGIRYYAAFAGCSAETEASFETVIFLAKKADELNVPCILTMENEDKKLSETILRNTAAPDREILTLHSMQSVTLSQAQSGTTYLSLARNNLDTLKTALRKE